MKGDDNEMKFEFYLTQKKVVHINCVSGRFYNGTILSIEKEKKFIIFIDRKLGEVPIMFEEIISIEPFREVGE